MSIDTASLLFVKGKNLIDASKIMYGTVSHGTGVYNYLTYAAVTDYIPVSSGSYHLHLFNAGSGNNRIMVFRIAGYDENKNYLWDNSDLDTIDRTITGSTTRYLRICFAINGYQTITSLDSIKNAQPQLEVGTSATTFEAYIDKKIVTKNSNNSFDEFYTEKNEKSFGLTTNYSVDTQNSYAIGNIVNINFNMYTSSALTKDTWTELATIPTKYRPSSDVYLSAYGSDGGWTSPVAVPIKIDNTGKIYAFLKTTIKRIVISGSYLQL